MIQFCCDYNTDLFATNFSDGICARFYFMGSQKITVTGTSTVMEHADQQIYRRRFYNKR